MITLENVLCEIVNFSIFLIIVWLIYYAYDYYKQYTNIPGPIRLPYIGNFLSILYYGRGEISIMQPYLRKQYGEISRLFIGDTMTVFLLSKDMVQEAFVAQKDKFSQRPAFMNDAMCEIKNGLVCSSGHLNRLQRRVMSQYFREFGMQKTRLEYLVLEEIDFLYNVFDETKSHPFNAESVIGKATQNIIHTIVFGKRLDYDDERISSLKANFNDMFKSSKFLDPSNYFHFLSKDKNDTVVKMREAVKRIKDYIQQEVFAHKLTYDQNNIRDFIDVYIETERDPNGKALNTENLIATIFDIFAGGSQTTTDTIMWFLLSMIKYPSIQERCFREISDHLGSDRVVSLSDKPHLTYIEATIMEAQRMGNVALNSFPHSPLTDTYVNGYFIPQGAIVTACFAEIHYDEKEWVNPHEFNPERFIDSENNIRKPSAFMPFSVGPKSCPGESMGRTSLFLICANIIQRFRLEKSDDKPLTFDGIVSITHLPKPFDANFIPRNH